MRVVSILAAAAVLTACSPKSETPVASSTSAVETVAAVPAQVTADENGLPRQAKVAEGFVPAGWKLEIQKQGDLNGDKLPDLAMVLRQADPANVLKDQTDENNQPLDTNPRILAVALANTDGYRLGVSNRTLIPRREQANADDFLDGIDIVRGNLHVDLRVFMSSGGWTASSMKYTFRYRDDRLELIGYDGSDMQRNTGDFTDISVNYLTGRMQTSKGNIENETPGKGVWSDLPQTPLLTIDQVGNGIEFTPAS